ncbi:MAG TPA: ParB/RepB/Spo0J family partition protein [Magnetospirillaceae bacterium]|nr:ParB/RepB/Spo0J family partition protein [Magnetospirillaceae bacterium]
MNEIIERIPLDSIVPAPGNRRIGGMDETQLAELAESIKMIGVQQPAVVRRSGGSHYELVAGERRWLASRLAGLDYLPCVVRELTDAQAMHIRIVENLQREDIHPLDEADGFAELREAGFDAEAVAREIGRSAVYVYQRLKLRDLIPAARALLVDRRISAGHANLIARLPDAQQKEVIDEIINIINDREIPSIRGLDKWIRNEILMQLSGAAWKMDDETLLPVAGACRICPKRSGAAPELFGDLGKKDQCTDRECFRAKGQAMVARRREELKTDKVEVIEVLDHYIRGDTPRGVLQDYQWSECKKSDPGAKRVLVVDGDHPGRLTWGKAHGSGVQAVDPEAAKRGKERKARVKKILATAAAIQDELYRGIMAQADLAVGYRAEQSELLALRRIATKQIFGRAGWDACSAYMRREGIESPKGCNWAAPVLEAIDSMDTRALDRCFLAIVFGGIPKSSEYSHRVPGTLVAGAAAIGLNVQAIVEDRAKAAGLTADEVNPPPLKPWRPGAEEEEEAEEEEA